MGTRPRTKPQHLPRKLLAVRRYLGLSQSEMSARLGFQVSAARISEYEHGVREPTLLVLLPYARAARVSVAVLIDDKRELPERFKESLPVPHRLPRLWRRKGASDKGDR